MKDRHSQLVYDLVLADEIDEAKFGLDSNILDSWKRCVKQYSLEPDKTSDVIVLTESEFCEAQEPLNQLIFTAGPELDRLFAELKGYDYLVLLCDANGMVLDSRCKSSLESAAQRFGHYPGAVWGEDHQGTNGVGTCIQSKSPITVLGEEHFSLLYAGLTCNVAPIFDENGALLAVLDTTTARATTHQTEGFVRRLVQQAAKRIGYSHFRQKFSKNTVLRLSSYPDFIDVTTEVLLAVDEHEVIIGASNALPGVLNLSDQKALCGLNINKLLGTSLDNCLSSANATTPVAIRDKKYTDIGLYLKCDGGPQSNTEATRKVARKRLSSTVVNESLSGPFAKIAGNDPQMIRNAQIAQKVIARSLPILLLGETGVGKGLFAKSIHEASDRKDKPFIAVNCAAIPENLIESELFGYRPGAFTGADSRGYKGKLLEANHGTLFLDEIGDMPIQLQTRLLRVLSEGEITPLGSQKTIGLDINVISATLKDLDALLSDGSFREDLYYRLNGACLKLPPLRARHDKADIITRVLNKEHKLSSEETLLSESVQDFLEQYFWPGNIRELENVLRYAAAICEDGIVALQDLPPYLQQSCSGESDTQSHDERDVSILALKQTDWNVSAAAELLKISRSTLHRRIKTYDIKRA